MFVSTSQKLLNANVWKTKRITSASKPRSFKLFHSRLVAVAVSLVDNLAVFQRRLQEISERQEQELREQELTRQRNAEELAHAMEQQEKDLENKELALQQHTSAAPEPNSEEYET